MGYMPDKNTIKVEKWFGKKKKLAAVRTVCSQIENLFKGVTKGYLYKMRAVCAHFPINCVISEGGTADAQAEPSEQEPKPKPLEPDPSESSGLKPSEPKSKPEQELKPSETIAEPKRGPESSKP